MAEAHDKWRCIPGYEDRYQACRGGMIRSIYHGVKLLKTTRHRDGYDKLNLWSAAGKQRTFHVHTLIALTFLGPRPLGHVIDHIDGDHTNHAVWNLRYLSPRESNFNRKKNGTSEAATGMRNVYHHGRGGYYVRVFAPVRKRLGRFATLKEAIAATAQFRQSHWRPS